MIYIKKINMIIVNIIGYNVVQKIYPLKLNFMDIQLKSH